MLKLNDQISTESYIVGLKISLVELLKVLQELRHDGRSFSPIQINLFNSKLKRKKIYNNITKKNTLTKNSNLHYLIAKG